jgi:hypothetical protein
MQYFAGFSILGCGIVGRSYDCASYGTIMDALVICSRHDFQ